MTDFLLCSCGCGGALHGPAGPRLVVTVRPLTPPAPVEPVTLEEAKGPHLHIEPTHTLEDELLQGFITAARQRIELDTERSWAQQTLEARYQNITAPQAALPLRSGPVQAVTAVDQVALDGAITALTGWRADLSAEVVWPPSAGWPAPPTAVVITYDAGPLICPEPVRQAILLLVGQYYTHRASIHVGSGSVTLPYGVEWLLAPYRASTGFVPA